MKRGNAMCRRPATRRPSSRLISPSAAALLLLMLAGCAQLPGTPPQAVRVPDDCDALAQPVPPPGVETDDLGVKWALATAALIKANDRLAAVQDCHRRVREAFQ